MADGSITIDVDVNGDSLNGLNSDLASVEGNGEKASLSIGKIVTALGLVELASAAFGALKDGIGASLNEGAALQQSLGGIETLFKDSGDKVKAYADEAYKTAGMSANSYMETVTSFSASLLQSMGGDTEAAADTANMAMIDMADNSNKMGTSMESIQDAYKGFAKQNYAMLDNLSLGYGGTKTEMERLLADAEKLTGVKYDINNLDDVYNAIHAVQEEMGIAGTTAKEASETFTGSFAAMSSVFKDVLGGLALGEDITPKLKDLASTTKTFLIDNFIPMFTNILKGLPAIFVAVFNELKPYVKEAFSGIFDSLKAKIPPDILKAITKLGDVVYNFLQSLKKGSGSVDGFGIALKVIKGVFLTLLGPIGLFAKAFELVVKALGGGDVSKGIDTIMQSFDGLAQGIKSNGPNLGKSFGKALEGILGAIAKALPGIVSGALKVVAGFISGIAKGLPMLTAAAFQFITAFTGAMLVLIPTVVLSATAIIVAFLGALTTALPRIIEAGGKLINAILQGITEQLPALITSAASLIVTWLTALNEHMPEILQAGFNLLITFLQGIALNIGAITDQAISIVVNFVQAIVARMPDIVNAAVDLIVSFVNGLASRMPDIIGSAVTLIASFINGIANNLWQIIDAAVNLIVQFVLGIANNIEKIVDAGMYLIDKIVEGLLQAQDRLFKAVTTLINGMAENIRNNKEEVKSAAVNLLDAIIGVFVPDALFDVGKNIIQGLIDGVGSMIDAAAKKVGEVASGIKENITGALGIHSPSRWMRDHVGKFIPQGIANGIDADARTAYKAMDSLVGGLKIPSINAEAALGISSRMSISPSGINAAINNNHSIKQNENIGELVSAVNALTENPIVAVTYLDSNKVSKGLGSSNDEVQGQRTKFSGWGLEIQ
ncbi:phage tail protein [Carnobacterium maltaromaticum]|uniref:phage tail protein n=1 Tax=Carnobacterium maltaromaticum TaxID=2751 RepID=UPI00068F9B0C|nr:hypothetical protein [Carnobacterium maltaromaticum]KRN61615.1 tape measure protein [Carnobacterium maltaromaticum DSM 20342]